MKTSKTPYRAILGVLACLALVLGACVPCFAYNTGYTSTYESVTSGIGVNLSPNFAPSPYGRGSWDSYTDTERDALHIIAGWSYRFKFVPYNAVPTSSSIYSPDTKKYNTADVVMSFNNPTYAGDDMSVTPPLSSTNLLFVPSGGDGYNNTLPTFNSVSNTYNASSDSVKFEVADPGFNKPLYAYRGSFVGRLLFAENDSLLFGDRTTFGEYFSTPDDNNGLEYSVAYRYKFVDNEGQYVEGSNRFTYYDNEDANSQFAYSVGTMLYLSLGESLIDYKSDDVTEHEFWTAYDGFDFKHPYDIESEEYSILFGACPRVFLDYVEVTMMPVGITEPGSGLDPREIGLFDMFTQNAFFGAGSSLSFFVDFDTTTYVEDGLEYYYTNAIRDPMTPDEPDWFAFTLDWLSDAVSGILSVEFVPYITLGSIVAIILGFAVVMWWLKVYGGG